MIIQVLLDSRVQISWFVLGYSEEVEEGVSGRFLVTN